MLEGRRGGLVGTRAFGEENGPCLLYGYDFVFGFLCLLLQASGFCRRDFPLGRACCSDGGVCNVGVGGG